MKSEWDGNAVEFRSCRDLGENRPLAKRILPRRASSNQRPGIASEATRADACHLNDVDRSIQLTDRKLQRETHSFEETALG